jgi:sodium/bile acid cotransporter 7
MMNRLNRLIPDRFLLMLLGTLLLASLLPVRGAWASRFDTLTDVAIAMLFFLHGAKLSREAIVQGIGAWRLHLMVLATTFALFPIIGFGINLLLAPFIDPLIAMGLLYLCILPSTVQSSIAMTSIARGNVPAAVCSASLSNLLGIFLTPSLASLFFHGQAGMGSNFFLSAVGNIMLTLLLPFVLGHFSRPLTGAFMDRHKALIMRVDRGAILLVVYTAFSAAIVEGLWRRISIQDLTLIIVANLALLFIVLFLTRFAARTIGLPVEDETVLVFCGSKKSLASGVPIAGALFPAAQVGFIILPVMIFHQLQLIVCATIAQRYARRADQTSSLKGSLHAL